jgi:hypothetical protein
MAWADSHSRRAHQKSGTIGMAKAKYVYEAGFLGTGAVSRTFLAGLPALTEMLGPVFTPARRATPRVVTALGSGFTVDCIEELRGCRAMLVCAPKEESESLLQSATEAGVLAGLDTLLLAEESTLAAVPTVAANSVSDMGRVTALPLRRHSTFLVEGSLRFRRFCQKLLDVPISRLVMAGRESRTMVDAGMFLAEEFCLPLLEATQAAFIAAGIHRDQARELGAELLRESIENARFAGRKRWTGILHTQDGRKLEQIVRALHRENELLANLILGFSRQGLAVMGKDANWIPHLSGVPHDGHLENGHAASEGNAPAVREERTPRAHPRRTRA